MGDGYSWGKDRRLLFPDSLANHFDHHRKYLWSEISMELRNSVEILCFYVHLITTFGIPHKPDRIATRFHYSIASRSKLKNVHRVFHAVQAKISYASPTTRTYRKSKSTTGTQGHLPIGNPSLHEIIIGVFRFGF